ncbi:PIN-like domain-containing protein [Nocardia sp. NPDC057663]|uniref:PIN-like domain-containing protein n=1 Tax=Nocardia sp. NPDC057663 TaxID=3346201 RepID=UPI00366B782C
MDKPKGGLFSGFEGFIVPGPPETSAALRTGILAVDTNVLLNLYRYNETTRKDLLAVLSAAGGRLFVPHQVVREFWRNRQSVLGGLGGAKREVQSALNRNCTSTNDAIRRWAKSVALSEERLNQLLEQTNSFFESISGELGDGPARVSAHLPTSEDSVLAELASLLAEAVGGELPPGAWAAAVAEGERRVKDNEPPGFKDADKLESDLPERASGDYIIWLQLLIEGEAAGKDLVLVTADTKEDWWDRAERGQLIGPRRELIEEYFGRTGRRFFLLEPSSLLQHSASLGVGTSVESVQEIQRVRDEPDDIPWDFSAVMAVLTRLDQGKYVQAQVIREAAANGGGISRRRVYELDGRDQEQTLRGFTRPVTRVTAELQEVGLVPYGVEPLLDARYDAGVKSSHFAVPAEVVDILRRQTSAISDIQARVEKAFAEANFGYEAIDPVNIYDTGQFRIAESLEQELEAMREARRQVGRRPRSD